MAAEGPAKKRQRVQDGERASALHALLEEFGVERRRNMDKSNSEDSNDLTPNLVSVVKSMPPLWLTCGDADKKARVIGGQDSQPRNIDVLCSCDWCLGCSEAEPSPGGSPTRAFRGRVFNLPQWIEHCTNHRIAEPDTEEQEARCRELLLGALTVSTSEGGAQPSKPETLLTYLYRLRRKERDIAAAAAAAVGGQEPETSRGTAAAISNGGQGSEQAGDRKSPLAGLRVFVFYHEEGGEGDDGPPPGHWYGGKVLRERKKAPTLRRQAGERSGRGSVPDDEAVLAKLKGKRRKRLQQQLLKFSDAGEQGTGRLAPVLHTEATAPALGFARHSPRQPEPLHLGQAAPGVGDTERSAPEPGTSQGQTGTGVGNEQPPAGQPAGDEEGQPGGLQPEQARRKRLKRLKRAYSVEEQQRHRDGTAAPIPAGSQPGYKDQGPPDMFDLTASPQSTGAAGQPASMASTEPPGAQAVAEAQVGKDVRPAKRPRSMPAARASGPGPLPEAAPAAADAADVEQRPANSRPARLAAGSEEPSELNTVELALQLAERSEARRVELLDKRERLREAARGIATRRKKKKPKRHLARGRSAEGPSASNGDGIADGLLCDTGNAHGTGKAEPVLATPPDDGAKGTGVACAAAHNSPQAQADGSADQPAEEEDGAFGTPASQFGVCDDPGSGAEVGRAGAAAGYRAPAGTGSLQGPTQACTGRPDADSEAARAGSPDGPDQPLGVDPTNESAHPQCADAGAGAAVGITGLGLILPRLALPGELGAVDEPLSAEALQEVLDAALAANLMGDPADEGWQGQSGGCADGDGDAGAIAGLNGRHGAGASQLGDSAVAAATAAAGEEEDPRSRVLRTCPLLLLDFGLLPELMPLLQTLPAQDLEAAAVVALLSQPWHKGVVLAGAGAAEAQHALVPAHLQEVWDEVLAAHREWLREVEAAAADDEAEAAGTAVAGGSSMLQIRVLGWMASGWAPGGGRNYIMRYEYEGVRLESTFVVQHDQERELPTALGQQRELDQGTVAAAAAAALRAYGVTLPPAVELAISADAITPSLISSLMSMLLHHQTAAGGAAAAQQALLHQLAAQAGALQRQLASAQGSQREALMQARQNVLAAMAALQQQVRIQIQAHRLQPPRQES
ncbi:hypothetical protein GPECTOR_120g418 [Gonium pectorale]|uniref:Uncharacterized protein n=1 Tax=Gonium pectorale TaxID=33097 RepID=A0A150FYR5_GONPE|nr:hypothetical protein GPECTOR_120g418 [Gonium pectorale]|eukprot:KXZ42751.1 hypothetical protein GPECTOR_120g418 [Gonium pectorale]